MIVRSHHNIFQDLEKTFSLWTFSKMHKIENVIMKSHVLITQGQQFSAFCQNKTLKPIYFIINSFKNFSILVCFIMYMKCAVYMNIQIYNTYIYIHLYKPKRYMPGSMWGYCLTPLWSLGFGLSASLQCQLLHGAHVDPRFPLPRALTHLSSASHLSSGSTFLGKPFLPFSPGRASWMWSLLMELNSFLSLHLSQSVIYNYRLIQGMTYVCLSL